MLGGILTVGELLRQEQKQAFCAGTRRLNSLFPEVTSTELLEGGRA
jgi:hypothetical protein